MKTLTEINDTIKVFENQYKLPVGDVKQNTEEWLKLKLGVISASNASKVVAKKGTDTRNTYLCQLVAQVCTGITEELNNRYVEWGKLNEDAARSSYEFSTGYTVTELPFVFKDTKFRVGCSPDFLSTESKGGEIKCPYNSENYVKFLVADEIKPEYQWQNQFTMYVLGCDSWDFAQFDPRMKKSPLHMVTIERDEEMQKKLTDAIPELISDMDKMLKKIGVKFGDQWRS